MWIILGALSGFIAVAAGAFGAHGLREHLSRDALEVWETAARYQMYHALALCAAGLLPKSRASCIAGWAFSAGSIVFSGSLYALALSGLKGLGAITPFGGVAFLVGWLAMAIAGYRHASGPGSQAGSA